MRMGHIYNAHKFQIFVIVILIGTVGKFPLYGTDLLLVGLFLSTILSVVQVHNSSSLITRQKEKKDKLN
jgi:hypothetical protein